jgi:arsenate reductase
MIKIMFLCTGNSCRSQMAEGFAREFGKGLIEPYSAGLIAAGVNPTRAVAVMKEFRRARDEIKQKILELIDS